MTSRAGGMEAYGDDERRRRRRGGWWLWGLLLLLLLGLALLLLRGCGDDGEATGAGAGGVAETAADAAGDAAGDGEDAAGDAAGDGEDAAAGDGDAAGDGGETSGEGEDGEGGAGGEAGDGGAAGAGSLTAAGRSLLGGGDLAAAAGEPVSARDVRVLSLAGESGFWVGTGDDDRVFVHMAPHGTAVPQSIRPGRRVSFTGTLDENPPDTGRVHGLTGDDARELERQGFHIAIDRGALAGG